MKLRLLAAFAALAFLPSCGGDEDVTITETRRVTLKDQAPKLHATSDERFRNTRPSPLSAPTPEGWLQVPATEFRLLNYRFGDQGMGEVWVSVANGGLLENVNRWLGQFDLEPIDQSTLDQWGKVPVGASDEGVWIEAQGTYKPGMGQPPRPDHALAGVIVEATDGLITIKMVGPKADVESHKDELKAYAASVKWNRH